MPTTHSLKHPRRRPRKYHSLLGLIRWGIKIKKQTKTAETVLTLPLTYRAPLTEPKIELKTGKLSARMSERGFYASSAAALFLMSDEGSLCCLQAEGTGRVSFGSFSLHEQRK